jgi:lipopolysaccharide export system protein LptA
MKNLLTLSALAVMAACSSNPEPEVDASSARAADSSVTQDSAMIGRVVPDTGNAAVSDSMRMSQDSMRLHTDTMTVSHDSSAVMGDSTRIRGDSALINQTVPDTTKRDSL